MSRRSGEPGGGTGPESGLSGSALLASCYRAFQAAGNGVGIYCPDWPDVDDVLQVAFACAVKETVSLLEAAEEAQEDLTWSGVAANQAFRFMTLAGEEPPEVLPGRQALQWEALVRHAANCLDYDEEEHGPMDGHEAGWADWTRNQIERRGLP